MPIQAGHCVCKIHSGERCRPRIELCRPSLVEMRTLVAGFGNVLRGDDGFGVEVVRRLADDAVLLAGIELLEVGTGGIRLVQALADGYDQLVIVDAVARGVAPGTLCTLAVEGVPEANDAEPCSPAGARRSTSAVSSRADTARPLSRIWATGCSQDRRRALQQPIDILRCLLLWSAARRVGPR